MPYEYIIGINNPYLQGQQELQLIEYATKLGFKDFKKIMRLYRLSIKEETSRRVMKVTNFVTEFDDQKDDLDTGQWHADENGIWREGVNGTAEIACSHPIKPVQRLRNINTGEYKVRLAFRRGTSRPVWNEIIVGFDVISNSRNIINLATIGISVASGKSAQNLVEYLKDVLDLNFDALPELKSVARMGWNEEGFAPYVDDIVFDGADSFGHIFKAIKPTGKPQPWLDEALEARQKSITARILLAASFASVLVEPLGGLPFFVHLWGMDSGTGKTVGQMLAASVWADPSPGGPFLPTFKGTSTSIELRAGFLHSLPVFLDELQLARDNHGHIIFNIYELASGSGKGRGTRGLGLAETPSWTNCFITSGETPLVVENDGAGAINRVIEIECKAGSKVIENGHRTANIARQNYGHAGKLFINCLCGRGCIQAAKEMYEEYYQLCMKTDTTEKQAMAAALILTADALATAWIFKDNRALTVLEIADFLKSRESVSAAERGYSFMCDWVSQNANKLRGGSNNGEPLGETFGLIGQDGADYGWVYINRGVWNKVCSDNGISSRALLSHLRSLDLIQTRGKAMTKPKRINGMVTECVMMKLSPDQRNDSDGNNDEMLPL